MATRQGATRSFALLREVVGSKFKDVVYNYLERDVILYALAVGVSTGQSNALRFLHEARADFTVMPTFGITPAMTVITEAIVSGNFSGFHFDPKHIVLGEQYLKVFHPLPKSGHIISKGCIAEVLDKGASGICIATNVETYDQVTGTKLAFAQSVLFIRESLASVEEQGHEAEKNTLDRVIIPLSETPDRTPDASFQEGTSVNQSAMYRLVGPRDVNRLHIDTDFSRLAGFQSPIMHGVCLLGIASRHVLQVFCDNDVTRFRAIKVRFTSPVYPGDTLRSDMWKESLPSLPVASTRIHFRTTNETTGKTCMARSYVDLCEPLHGVNRFCS